jgi:hypothetical protein
VKPVARDDTDQGQFAQRDFECHHPNANVGFNGSFGVFESPLPDDSDATRDATNQVLASTFATMTCSAMAGVPCSAGAPRPMQGGGYRVDIALGSGGAGMRVLVAHPYLAIIGVLGENYADSERILSSVKLPPRQ